MPEAVDVFAASFRDLLARHGLLVPELQRDDLIRQSEHGQRTGIYRGAFVDGRLVSICNAVVRDGTWFLAMLWTLPGFQAQGLGGQLLDQVWQAGVDQGAHIQFVWASIDFPAVALYLRHGMLPGCQIFSFTGPGPATAEGPAVSAAGLDLQTATGVDEQVRNIPRETDHRMWLAKPDANAWQLRRGGRLAGYAYLQGDSLGPIAWLEPDDAWPVLDFVFGQCAGRPRVRLSAAGLNHAAIRWALARGLRLTSASHLLTTRALPGLERYVPSGPALF